LPKKRQVRHKAESLRIGFIIGVVINSGVGIEDTPLLHYKDGNRKIPFRAS
jgi:hypothetical protein